MNGGEAPSITGKETVCKNAFPGTQGLSFPLTKVMYVLDVEHGVLVHTYIFPKSLSVFATRTGKRYSGRKTHG